MMKEKNNTSKGKGILYLLAGGGIGAALALLFAPKTGKQLRGEIGSAATDELHKVEKFAGKVGDKAGEVYDAAKHKLSSATDSLTEFSDKIETAVEDKGKEIWADVQGEKSHLKGETKVIDGKGDFSRTSPAPKIL